MDLHGMLAALREYFDARVDEVAAVYVFGSAAHGHMRPDSDIDVGVLFRTSPPPTLHGQPFDLAADLERQLSVPVDVAVLNTAPVDLRIRVLRGGQLVVEHDRTARIQFEVATRNEFFDLEPVLAEYRRVRRSA